MSTRSRRGFTLLEAVIAMALLSALVLLAGVVTRGSMSATARNVALDTVDGRMQRALDLARARLRSASLATLEYAAPGDPTLLALPDGVPSDNVAFRQMVGFEGGAPRLFPDATLPPMRLWREPDDAGGGLLWFDDGLTPSIVARGVTRFVVTRSGKRLDLEVDHARPDVRQFATTRLSVALVAP